MNKRGDVGLSMNTVVIAIIAIIILLLIVTFFTGGLSTIGQRITEVFKKGTAGYDLDLAIKNCEDFCARAQRLPEGQQPNSAWCGESFNIEGRASPQDCRGLGLSCEGVSCQASVIT